MSAHRRHLITRKSDGAFWAGRFFGFKPMPSSAVIFDSPRAAFAELCEVDAAPNGEHEQDCYVEPADWYLPDSVLYPLREGQ